MNMNKICHSDNFASPGSSNEHPHHILETDRIYPSNIIEYLYL